MPGVDRSEQVPVSFESNRYDVVKRQLDDQIADKHRILRQYETEIAAERKKRELAEAFVEALRDLDKSTLPCGHNAQYGWTGDGGKRVFCLLCSLKRYGQHVDCASAFCDVCAEECDGTTYDDCRPQECTCGLAALIGESS
jgi:hypothetical protein